MGLSQENIQVPEGRQKSQTCQARGWEAEKREQFDVHWPKVRAILAALEELDIYMVDVSPVNIAFSD